jgi:hypothetical protein
MHILLTSIGLVALITSGLLAQSAITVPADSAEQTALAIYANAAIVRQQFRPLVAKGENTLSFERLPELIAPGTVLLRTAADKAQVKLFTVEQTATTNLDVLQAYVGRNVILRQRGGIVEGELVVPPSSIAVGAEPCYSGAVIRTRSGELLVSPCGELVLPPPLPPLTLAPRIVSVLDAKAAGTVPLELLYQCDGLQWQASYTAMLLDDRTLELVGYVHVANQTRTRFQCNSLQLVAGNVILRRAPARYKATAMALASSEAISDGYAPTEEALGENHLYTVPFGATIVPNATTTLLLRAPTRYQYSRRLVAYGYPLTGYESGSDETQIPVSAVIEFANTSAEPLPAGTVRVWQADRRGNAQLLGEDNISHTPTNEKMLLRIGESFDVKASRRERDYKRLAERVAEYTIEYSVRNRKTTATQVNVIDSFTGDWEITASTIPYTKRSSREAAFVVSVPPGEVVTFRYTVRHRW